MRAVLLALSHFKLCLESLSIVLATDNTTVVAYLKNQGGTHCYSLYQLANDVLIIYSQFQIRLVETYSRASECSCGLSFQVLSTSQYRVGTSSGSLSIYSSSLGKLQYRSIHNKSELQGDNFRLPSSRPQSLCCGRNEPILGGIFAYEFPPFRFLVPVLHKITGEKCRIIVIAPAWPKQAWFANLLRLSCASLKTKSSISVQRGCSSSFSRKTPSTRLVSVRDNLRQKGFSEIATKHISRSVRESTSIVYDSKWTIFSDWCVGKEIDSFKISVQQLADFLVFLFQVKGLTPSTVKGYRSAISRTIHISGGEDFGNNQFIYLLVRNFSLERTRQRVLVPQWNLCLVLSALNLTPFEPAEEVDLKFLSYKCGFLLALASGRRRSEVHAFSTCISCLKFSRDKSSGTLLTDPAFLGKPQIPDKGAEPIYIPALPQDSDSVSLCPVRIVSIYLTRTASLRSSTNKKLFIPIKKGVSDLSVKTISTWRCRIISLACESSGQVILDKSRSKLMMLELLHVLWHYLIMHHLMKCYLQVLER